jgi:polysaccharide export outer membrane protein
MKEARPGSAGDARPDTKAMIRNLLVATPLLLVMALWTVVHGQEEASARTQYQIGAGDVLEISVWKNEQLSRPVTVRPDGMISLPLINDVQAAGLTPMQLREVLAKKLNEYIPSAEVSVIVNKVESFAVSVVGSVAKPGRYSLSAPTTVLEALAMAGGLTQFASHRNIFVLRTEGNTPKRLAFDYNKATSSGDPTENFLLRAGDVVVVP